MDLFHFDTSNLEPAEVDFVVATLQKRDRKLFVKLPWDRKTKAAVLRQQPATLPAQRRGTFPSGSRQASAGSRHGGPWPTMHIPARVKPPRLQRGQQQRSSDTDRQQPPAIAVAAGVMQAPPPSSAQLLGPATYSAATAAAHMSAVPVFVKELHRQQHQPHPHQEPVMGRYYMLPGGDEASGMMPPQMELCMNYMHSGGMVVGMPPMHHGSDVPSPPPGMSHHHPHQLVMPPGSIGMSVHGGGYAVPMQHVPSSVRGHFPMQSPYMTSADMSLQPQMFYQCLPTAAAPMTGGPPVDVIYTQQSMFHHHQLPMPPYPPAARYSMTSSSVPAAMMMPMNASPPGCMQGLTVNVEPATEVAPAIDVPHCVGSDDTQHQLHEAVDLKPLVVDPEPATALSAVPRPAWQQVADSDASRCPAPAADDVIQLPAAAAVATAPVTVAPAATAALVFHSRQSSSGSSTVSDDSLLPDSSCAFGKVYERRNKKKRPADFYERLKSELQQVQGAAADVPTDGGCLPLAAAAEQPGPQQKEGAGTPKSSGTEVEVQESAVSSSMTGCTTQQPVDQSASCSLSGTMQAQQLPEACAPAAAEMVSIVVAVAAPSAAAPAKATDVPIGGPSSACAGPVPDAQASTRDAPAAAAAVVTSSVSAPAETRTPSSVTLTPVPAVTLSWAQRVQMQSGRAAGPQQHGHDPAGAGQRAAANVAVRTAVEQPPTPPRSGDLGALLASLELSSRPFAVHPRGFINKGNWCYANATLQALLACPMFFNFLASLPKDPALCAAGASKTPLLDTLVALCNEFTRFERGGSASAPVQPLVTAVAAAAAQPAKVSAATTAGQQQAASRARQQQLDLKPGPPFDPTIVSRLVQTMLNKNSASFAHGKQEDAEEFHSALLDRLHSELLDAIKATSPSNGATANVACHSTATPVAPDPISPAAADVDASINGEVEWARVGPKNRHVVTRTSDLARSPVTTIFGGKLLSSVTQAGSSKTANVEPFLAVQLEIQSDDITSVTKALSALAKRETIDGYTCSKTRQEIETHRRLVFEELPQVLILHLKCFVYDKNGLHKITKKIEFSDTLSFSNDLLAFPNKYSGLQRTYRLCAVVHHSGTAATGGHYTTDAFHSGVNCWVRYDDSNISVVSSQSVFEFAAPRMPYLLYYQRGDLFSNT